MNNLIQINSKPYLKNNETFLAKIKERFIKNLLTFLYQCLKVKK